MQFSKAEKVEYSQSQIIKKIQKLKLEVSSAEDYSKLEKCAKKLEKINEAVGLHSDRKIRKQLRKMTEVCQGLIKQKTKYFKKKVLQQLNASSAKEKSQSRQKSLKYCKSVEAFPINHEIFARKKQPKRDEQQFWGDKTEVQVRSRPRLQELVENLKDQVATYKMRITLLQSTTNSIPQKLSEKQMSFEHQMGLKLKQKGLQIEQLKGKLKYHEQINQQLRNRLFNQQKRQQDYVDSLKSHINKLNTQIQRLQKDNKKLQDDLLRQIQLNNTLKTQIQRLLQLSDMLQREKRQRQQSEVLKMKDSGIKRELETLSQQERYMREMEHALNMQKQQRLLTKQQLERVNKKMIALQEQIGLYEKQKQKLSELLEIKGEQISGLKKQLSFLIEQNKHRQEQLSLTRDQLHQCQIGLQRERERKSSELTRKTQYLKRVKQLLN